MVDATRGSLYFIQWIDIVMTQCCICSRAKGKDMDMAWHCIGSKRDAKEREKKGDEKKRRKVESQSIQLYNRVDSKASAQGGYVGGYVDGNPTICQLRSWSSLPLVPQCH